MNEKQCATCQEVKDIEAFSFHSPGKRRGQCWECRNQGRRKKRAGDAPAPVVAEPIRYPVWGGPVFERTLVGRL